MRISVFAIAFFLSLPCFGEMPQTDSVKVESWLKKGYTLPSDSNRCLFYALQMLGTPYASGTLEAGIEERLIVRTDSVDCTTFVETVLALTLAERDGMLTYSRFKYRLRQIRYRGGIIDGYASRLHYFSDWVCDNERKGILEERTCSIGGKTQYITLNFMTMHPDSYPALKNDISQVGRMKRVESRWQHRRVCYIPKSKLNKKTEELGIHNGDILAFTTSVGGLDVVHMGFACRVGENIHLLHASSEKGEVVLDIARTLFEYSVSKRTHTGIRVVSPV